MRLFKTLLALAALCWVALAGAQVPVPALTGRVVDQTGTLDQAQRAALEQTLRAFEERKGTQIAVLLVPTTAPESIEQFSIRVADRWKLGRKQVDDGAIVVVAKDDRATRIEVGRGLEGALTDLTSHRIIDEVMLPRFGSGDFGGGLSAGVDRMIRVVDGEPLPAPRHDRPDPTRDIGGVLPVLFIVALGLGGLLRSVLGRVPGALLTGGAVGVVAWFLAGAVSMAVLAGIVALVVTLVGGFGRHAIGGYYGGGWGRGGAGGFGGGGGGGGGGFSGGGGSFGGGGASGRW